MNKLNVFSIKAYGVYGGGMAIVSACNATEAIEVASTIQDNTWHTKYGNPEAIEDLALVVPSHETTPRVWAHFEVGE